MINWNDVNVAQEIAQERYQTIVQARQAARAKQASAGYQDGTAYEKAFGWLGRLMVSWGCRLQTRDQAAAPSSICVDAST